MLQRRGGNGGTPWCSSVEAMDLLQNPFVPSFYNEVELIQRRTKELYFFRCASTLHAML